MSTTNTLIAFRNILERNSCRLTPIFRQGGSANAAGDSLEYFIKDMYCTQAQSYQFLEEKERVYDRYLSWKGDSKRFPDFIVKNGVGVEPKKLNGYSRSSLSLNSSFPKDYIYPNSQNVPYIDEVWEKKDVVYVVGNLEKSGDKLLTLWLAYGNTFVADNSSYLQTKETIVEKIKEITTLQFVPSLELGRATRVDPLGLTNLRLRGMWELAHPANIFQNYLTMNDIPTGATKINLVILKKDYEEIPIPPEFNDYLSTNKMIINEVGIPDPNNPSELLEALILESYTD